jgi:two-component system, NtrC family, response regulator AtoC
MQASIFVAEDESAVRRAIVKRLARCRHRVRDFESGQDVLAALEEDPPDVMIVDLKMPGLSGIEVLKTVQAKGYDTAVIILTAYGCVEDAVEAMKLGAYDFVIKTVDLQGMETVVEGALQQLSRRRESMIRATSEAAGYG